MVYEEIPRMTQMQKPLMLIRHYRLFSIRFDPIIYQLNQNMKTNCFGIYVNCKENVCISEVGIVVQLNEYETAPYFIQLSQNLTSDCLLFLFIYLFLPVFAFCAHKIVLQIKTKQFDYHIMQELVKTGKFS